MVAVIGSAMTDIVAGIKMRPVWMALASEDIHDQHRRTRLGPAWLLINYLAFAGTFVILFGYTRPTVNFPAYVALGLFVWIYMSELMALSVTLFKREQGFIKGTTLPLTVYVLRMTMQSLIRAGYALAGCIGIMLVVGTPLTIGWLWSAAAMVLILFASPAFITVFAISGAYFPDFQFIVQNLIRIGVFLTPIFWVPHGGGIRGALYRYNPFTYFLEIVRAPILVGTIPIHSVAISVGITLFVWLAAILLLGKLRKQVVFVL